jgi:pimeloyl-ACP methyl ester carboxylesterase
MTEVSAQPIWIDVPGGRLAAEDEGHGPAILLVHSAIVNRRAWDPVTPLLVAAGYRVIRHDMRGFGQSTTEDIEYGPHEDIVAVLDHFGVGRAAIVGNSMGANFSLNAVLAKPGRFVAFVWVGGGIGGWNKEPSSDEQALFQADSDAEEAGDADLTAELDTQIWVDGPGQPPTRVNPAVRAAIKAMNREGLEPGRVFGNPQQLSPPAVDRLGSIAVPTLVVIGDLDTSGTRASAQKLADGAPGARIVHMPDVAHIIGMEAPDRLAALIVEHLAPLSRWT